MKLLKKSQIEISFNTFISVLIAAVVFILVFKISQVFMNYTHDKYSFDALNYLELNLKNLYTESDYTKKITLDKSTDILFDSQNFVMPRLKKTISIGSNLVVAPRIMHTHSLTFFSKFSKFPIKPINYLFVYPTDYIFLIYNSSDPLANLIYSELPDRVDSLEGTRSDVLIYKLKIDAINKIFPICGKKTYCYLIIFNSPETYQDLREYNNIKLLHVKGTENFGEVTLSSKQKVVFFDRYTLLAAIISDDVNNYNELIKKLYDAVNTNYLIESKRLSYLYELEPTDKCKTLVSEINDSLFNITNIVENMKHGMTSDLAIRLNENYSIFSQKDYLLEQNDCYK